MTRLSTSALRLDNIDVFCEDIERMRGFYTDVIGAPLLYPHGEGENWFAIQAGDVSVYFLGSDVAPRDVHPPLGSVRGISSFSFAVDDLDIALGELDGKVEWTGDVREWRHPTGTWYRFRFFVDPEGNNVSVTEPHKVGG